MNHRRKPGVYQRRHALILAELEQCKTFFGLAGHQRVDAGIEQFENQITALIERADLRPLLPAITCPTLVATGDEDAWSPPEQHREIAASLPNAELLIFEHSGHMAPCETPDLVTGALRTWLKRPVLP